MAAVGGCAADYSNAPEPTPMTSPLSSRSTSASSRCADADIYVAMPADQALAILQACGKLSGQDAFGDSTWYFKNKVIEVTPTHGVLMITNLD